MSMDNNNIFVPVNAGNTLTIEQLRSLQLQTAQDGFGDTNFSFSVSDSGSSSGNAFTWVLNGSKAIAQAEATVSKDLDADGIVGVIINSTVFDPNWWHQGNGNSEYSRYVYDTTGGLLISRNWLESTDGSGMAGMGYTDLRQVSSSSDSWNGPSVVLISSDELDLEALKGNSDSAEIVSARLLQQSAGNHGSSKASGYELTVAIGDGATVSSLELISIDLDGSITNQTTLSSSVEINAKEVELMLDLNNNNVVGANIQSQLYSAMDNGNSARNLYQSSNGLIISKDWLETNNDMRYAMSDTNNGNDPSHVLLRGEDGLSTYSIPAGQSIAAVLANQTSIAIATSMVLPFISATVLVTSQPAL